MKIHVSGLRSRYISHSVSTTATTTSTTRSTARTLRTSWLVAAGALIRCARLSPPDAERLPCAPITSPGAVMSVRRGRH